MGKLVVFSGAGLSAESGVATFRDKNGLWENHRVEDVADFNTWKKNFRLVHTFYNQRRTQLQTVEPNAAHLEIAKWQQQYEMFNLTQNIDNLLERAGCTNVYHLHGYLTEMRCVSMSHVGDSYGVCNHVWDIGYNEYDFSPCPKCGNGWVKPKVVFFHEEAPLYSDLYEIFSSLTIDDVVVVIGTLGNVVPIYSLLFDRPSYNILCNLEESQYIPDDAFHQVFYEPATQSLPKVSEILKQRLG